jgi:hypothetical protein
VCVRSHLCKLLLIRKRKIKVVDGNACCCDAIMLEETLQDFDQSCFATALHTT